MVALKTFTNLPSERQEEIILICLQEFALHEYEATSLSNMVTRLGLAKGSFYRYFDSKKSLYFFLLDHCVNKRMAHDAGQVNEQADDFFDLLTQHFAARISFDQQYPLYSAFLYNVLNERNSEELGNIRVVVRQKAIDSLRAVIAKYAGKKKLRKDIDIDAMAIQVLQTQLAVFDFLAVKHGIDFSRNIREHKLLYDLPQRELKKAAALFTDMLRNGISVK